MRAQTKTYTLLLLGWLSVDPPADKYPGLSSYAYCANNPVMLVDPDGREIDDYKLDKKTGSVKKVAATNDGYDRILKSNSKGKIRTNKDGSYKVAIDNIPKGILEDNMNLRTEANLIYVGAEGQPTLFQVEEFMYNLSNYVDKEILSIYYSKENKSDAQITAVYLAGYKDNTYNSGKLKGIDSEIVPKGLFSNAFVHTHLLIDDGNYLSDEPSEADIESQKTLLRFGVKNFLIITRESRESNNLNRIKY